MTRSRQLSNVRLQKVMAAIVDEKERFNTAIRSGAIVMLTTFNGPYRVKYVDEEFWYHTDGNGGLGQSWCGCNDGKWADLLRQANVTRNPLFQD